MTSTWKGLTVGAWLLAVLCASVWAELDSKLDEQWEQWKTTHQKNYQNEVEELGRRALWEKNLNHINAHNLEASLGLHTYTLTVSHLSDLTEDEWFQRSAAMKIPEDVTPTPLNVTDVALPASVDWREAGFVTSVKNQQKYCQSCWAFSAVGALEGLLAKTKGTRVVDLSPQNLMDCSRPYGDGCKPGWMHDAFQYVINNKGIDSEASYPYEARSGKCRYNPQKRAATCSSFRRVEEDEYSLQRAVATFGPISVGVNERDIANYHSGVFNNPRCSKELKHAVLVVGYDTDRATGLDYWLIKNSWGREWGEGGYMRLARNKNQMCGISKYAVYPL